MQFRLEIAQIKREVTFLNLVFQMLTILLGEGGYVGMYVTKIESAVHA